MKKFLLFIAISLFVSQAFAQWTGSGTGDEPYQIKTSDDLKALSSEVAKGNTFAGKSFILINDINMQDISFTPIGGWDPTGTKNDTKNSFSGVFNGNNKEIKNLKIIHDTNSKKNYVGLFGLLLPGGYTVNDTLKGSAGIVSNLRLSNADISGSNFVGGIVGFIENGRIINCSTSGRIIGSSYVGGIAGFPTLMMIQNCYNSSRIIGNKYVGGIAGLAYNTTYIHFSFNKGTVIVSKHNGGGISGGLESYSEIANCYSTGNIEGGDYIGGVTGESYISYIGHSYNTGDIKGGKSFESAGNATYVGGLCGNHYPLKTQDGTADSIGGIINSYYKDGAVIVPNGTITNNNSKFGDKKTLSEMKSIDFLLLLNNDEIDPEKAAWKLDFTSNINSGTPILYWQTAGMDVGLNSLSKNNTNINVYPNPASSIVNVEIKGLDKNTNLTVTDIQGRVVLTQKASPNMGTAKVTINVSNLTKGIYFVKVMDSVTKLIVK